MKIKPNVLITGVAGFIGSQLFEHFSMEKKFNIVGVDALLPFNGLALKRQRLTKLGFSEIKGLQTNSKGNKFLILDLCDEQMLTELFAEFKFEKVIHFAAIPSVRSSKETSAKAYTNNTQSFKNLLKACEEIAVKKMIYASSSSVYGEGIKNFVETAGFGEAKSQYALSKRQNESDAAQSTVNTLGLRLFSVYGPWGRPDMAPYFLMKNLLDGLKANLAQPKTTFRDFTFVGDVIKVVEFFLQENTEHKVINVGSGESKSLLELWNLLQDLSHNKGEYNEIPLPPNDMIKTHANITLLKTAFPNFTPTKLNNGLVDFVNWFKRHYHM